MKIYIVFRFSNNNSLHNDNSYDFPQLQFTWNINVNFHENFWPNLFYLWNNLILHFDDIFDSREIALKSLIVISSLPLIKSLREKLNWAPLYLKTKSPFSTRADQYQRCVVSLYPPFHPWMNSNSFTNCIYADLLLHDMVDPAVFGFFCILSPPALVHLFWLRWYP